MFQHDDLVGELKALRKGRGAQSGQPVGRIGRAIRTACGIADIEDSREAYAKLADWLREMISHLPKDMRISALAAFGLHQQAQLRYFEDRVAWVARHLDRDPRTARRRIDEAINQIATLVVGGVHRVIDVDQFIDQPVELTFARCGLSTDDTVTLRCHLVAVAHDIDNQTRHLAVVDVVDHDTTILMVIPVTRILDMTSHETDAGYQTKQER